MTEPLRPAATKTYGKENWVFVPTIASATLAPTAAEYTAGTDISRIVFADGAPAPTQATNRASASRRYADTEQYEFIGSTQYTGGDIVYQFGPQGAAASDAVKLWETIPTGTTGFLVRRMGIARATAGAAGQFVDIFPVEFGPSMPVDHGDAEASEAAAMATFAVTSAPAFKKAILA